MMDCRKGFLKLLNKRETEYENEQCQDWFEYNLENDQLERK